MRFRFPNSPAVCAAEPAATNPLNGSSLAHHKHCPRASMVWVVIGFSNGSFLSILGLGSLCNKIVQCCEHGDGGLSTINHPIHGSYD